MTKEHTFPASFKDATGKMPFGLTNDYMFHAVFQKNQHALKGLICSVLHKKPEEIKTVIITNPIKIGEQIDEKAFILDIEVLLNNNHLINLEMQMANQYNWQDRSLSYLCRSFDQLYQGEAYTSAKPVTHIGFLNFTPFSDSPEFYATYKLLNTKNHRVYSDKFVLAVVDLKCIELATEEDKACQIDHWARLFTAMTWEELRMITENNTYLESASQTMYELSGDELVQRQCRARRDYYKQINTYNKNMQELKQELDVCNKKLEEQDVTIAQQDKTIEELQRRIAELEKQTITSP